MFRKGIISAALLSIGLSFIGVGKALSQTSREHVPLVLSRLPPPNSAAYKAVRARAGDVAVRALTLTKAEMWSVPRPNAEAVASMAPRYGIQVSRLEERWNHIFVRAPAGVAMDASQRAMMQRAMASNAATDIALFVPPQAGVVEYALTRNQSAAASGDTAIKVTLNHTIVTIHRTGLSMKPDMLVWRGIVEGTGAPATLMWWPGAQMVGVIQHEGRTYSIRCVHGVLHAIVEMSDDRMPPEHASMPQRLRADLPSLHDDPLVRQGDASILRSVLASLNVAGDKLPPSERKGTPKTDPAPQPLLPVEVVIDVIVAYTKKVAENYTDVVREVAALAIEESNEALRISGLGHIKLRLVHAYQTDYVEEGSHFDHVWRFADADDGYMEEIHELRNRHHADVAILIVDDNKGCGLATRVYADPDEAFAVVHQDCAVLTYSVAHEIGHLIGARHEINVDRAMTPFPYGHGFVNGTKWRDIMSYRESCGGCRRVPVWSNPRVLIDGERAGTPNEDNARVIAEQAARVAAFR